MWLGLSNCIAQLLSDQELAVEEIRELGGVSCLLSVIRETNCTRKKENCIAVLHRVCLNDRTKWKEIREEENTYGTISKLAQNGTSRAKCEQNYGSPKMLLDNFALHNNAGEKWPAQ
ncbi:U-box domain-containing protein 9-like [Pyrus ussuriensis x Pyrus communis]|uniref:U-box domain-containing protein 9-like n=1 Tax=Pyrus ussuriensis x Pyrus communis TaxID=2448454 RepID=A0A5N5I8X2_9ROSA|nr:U-box domain-containing protein 9-like [Pyrus ussuriensis x Pyrus communis]